MTESKTNIFKALVKAQSEFNTIKKDKNNPIAKSTYATLDAILEEVLPKLNKHGLFMTQEPDMRETDHGMQLGVKTTIYHESGEFIEYKPLYMPIEANARMNISQQSGSVITYAKRYAVSAILGISTDEDKDGVQVEKEEVKLDKETVRQFKMPFGKHKGKTLEQLYKEDRQYLKWMYGQSKTDDNIKKAIKLISEVMFEEEGGDPQDAETKRATE